MEFHGSQGTIIRPGRTRLTVLSAELMKSIFNLILSKSLLIRLITLKICKIDLTGKTNAR